jgi:hypothetical protein
LSEGYERWILFSGEEAKMSDLWLENLCNGLSALQGGPIFNLHAMMDGREGEEDAPNPEIKPPLPNEVPAPQPSQPEVEPHEAPPPADPGLPAPEA